MRQDIIGLLSGTWLLAQPLGAQVREQSTLSLPQCGGHVRIDRNEWQTVLRFEGVRQCPYVEIKGSRQSLELDADGTYRYMYVWHKPWVAQKLDFIVHTASGEKFDRYTLASHPETPLTAKTSPSFYLDEKRSMAMLPACQASIDITTHARGLAVTLQNTMHCPQIELLRFNQLPMNRKFEWERKAEPQEVIVDLPREAVHSGSNKVELRWGSTLIHYYFREGRWFFTGQ